VSERTANLIVISFHAGVSPLVHCAPQLACVNRKISDMTNTSDAIFAEAAYLAGKAIESATELQRMPGMSAKAFAKTHRLFQDSRDWKFTPLSTRRRRLLGGWNAD
jgi:hypothetical protein